MQTPPLFIKDYDTLKSSLRLSGSRSRDSGTLIEDGVRAARAEFFTRLGASTISTLKAIAHSDDPLTPDQLKRNAAELCELAMVRRSLLRTMPTFVLDPSTNEETWNDDGLVRRMTRAEVNSELERLDADIAAYLNSLSESSVAGIQIDVPEDKNPRPGKYDWTGCG